MNILLMAAVIALDAQQQPIYDAIYEPKIVAEQPNHTHKVMVMMPDGEIRYYGTDLVGKEKRKVYLSSRDRGLSWTTKLWLDGWGPMAYCPWGDFYYTMDFVDTENGGRMRFMRSRRGPDDPDRTFVKTDVGTLDFFRPMQPCEKNRLLIFGGARTIKDEATGRAWERPALAISSDDGATWREVVVTNAVTTGGVRLFNDKALRWDNGCCESTVVELSTGELWMACRATLRHHQLYKSKDGGRTWIGPEPMFGFYASNTIPTFLKLKDGRILFFWNNTEPLAKRDSSEYPELLPQENAGRCETVFTNRDALHVAISDDDGRTWKGFREVALNPIRNRADFREYGNARVSEYDKSVHQTQPMEMPGGKILLPYGQGASRRICIFDLRWIEEKGRYDEFRWGLDGLSNHLYLRSLNGNIRGWSGHCAFNRIPGAALVREPDTGASTARECLQVCRIRDERLVGDLQGVAWNFPAAKRGRLELVCRADGEGVRLAICDRWINPGDEHVADYAAFSLPIDAKTLGGAGQWKTLAVTWDWERKTAHAACDGFSKDITFRTEGLSPFGPSYLHLQTLAKGHDPKGVYFRSFRMTAED